MAEQWYVTTADEEKNYFTGDQPQTEQPPALPAGRYRVVAGYLVRLLPGSPP